MLLQAAISYYKLIQTEFEKIFFVSIIYFIFKSKNFWNIKGTKYMVILL